MKPAARDVYEVVVGQLSPGAVLDQYVVKGCIGTGGMALVYEAEDTLLRRPVAIKMLSSMWSADNEVRARFLREARAAATLRHPNVVSVFEVGRHRESPYLVMERLHGENLAQLLAREGPLSMRQTADLMIPVLSAIAAAHSVGIVHRDLKPENLYLSRSERGAITPKVLDFGISKMLLPSQDSDVTRSDVLLGTPSYMSPEHVLGNDRIDTRSDIFSLGVVMYECVTGKAPFQAASVHATLEAILRNEPAPPATFSRVNEDFSDIILRALHKSQQARYQTVRDLGADVLPFASTRVRLLFEQEFLPPGVSLPVRRAVRRMKRLRLLALAAALAGSALLLEHWISRPNSSSSAGPSVLSPTRVR